MKITKIKGVHPHVLIHALDDAIMDSRFTAETDIIEDERAPYQIGGINISKVRLRKSKEYCGNHPKACERPHSGPHRKHSYLEGADWVQFNDLLNDVLDKLGAEARIASNSGEGCIIRKGVLRRVSYDSNSQFPNGTWKWDYDTITAKDWVDNRGKGHITSWFPPGTPGVYDWEDSATGRAVAYNCVG
jgi:hypothetical protein